MNTYNSNWLKKPKSLSPKGVSTWPSKLENTDEGLAPGVVTVSKLGLSCLTSQQTYQSKQQLVIHTMGFFSLYSDFTFQFASLYFWEGNPKTQWRHSNEIRTAFEINVSTFHSLIGNSFFDTKRISEVITDFKIKNLSFFNINIKLIFICLSSYICVCTVCDT